MLDFCEGTSAANVKFRRLRGRGFHIICAFSADDTVLAPKEKGTAGAAPIVGPQML